MPKSDVVIWQSAGHPYGAMTYGHRLVELVEQAGHNAIRLPYMERPATAAELAAPYHLLSGGDVPVHDQGGAMQRALSDLNGVIDRAKTGQAVVIGTCLGAQMIAAALAGTDIVLTEPPAGTPGINVGLERTDRMAPAPASLSEKITVGVFHYHRVSSEFLKHDGVTHLYASKAAPMAGFRVGAHIFGYQFHPELTPDDMRQLIQANEAMIVDHGTYPEAAVARVDQLAEHWSADLASQLLVSPFGEAQRAA